MSRYHFPIEEFSTNELYVRFQIFRPVSNLLNETQSKDRFGGLVDEIFLHAPNQIQEGNSHRYKVVNGRIIAAISNVSDTTSIADIFGGLAQIAENVLPSAVENAMGIISQTVQNPQEEQLYQAPNFRTHSFSYELAATSNSDAVALDNIVNTFRKNSYPSEIFEGAELSTRFTVPNQFKITFLQKGKEGRVVGVGVPAKCVLTGFNVNFSGAGKPVMYKNGKPAFVNLDLTFTETNLLHQRHEALN
tara:strand:- start:1868 stop:2608 length:741 start_codon:yes stop_codon:yes gene_type:complete